MASTYSNLKFQLMATGENATVWGSVTNVNLGTAIEEAITGSADVTFASGNVTLTLTNTNATQTARNLRLNCTGTTGGARSLIVPAIEKVYIVNNGCADAITVKNSTGTGIAVPAGKTMWVFNDGTNVVDATNYLTTLALGTALPVASGGTGSVTATFSGANITALNASSISTGTAPVANGGTGQTTYTDGQLLIGNSSGNTLTKATLTEGSGITITNGNGSVTIAATGGSGTVTSVSGTGTVNGISLSGTVTTSGSLTLGGTLSGVSLTSQVTGTLPVANGGTGITSLGSGVATWLGTPSSANFAAALTDETGTGVVVFDTSPTITTPILVTPTMATPIIGGPVTPASASAFGVAGQILWDASFIYICVAASTWKRVAIATW